MRYLVFPLFVVLVIALFKCIRIIPQSNAYVIEFLGSYTKTLGNGLHFLVPFVERVANKVSLKEQVEDFPPQPVITKDNVTIQVDTVIYYTIFNPQLYTYGVDDPVIALANIAATTLRNIMGEMELDDTLTSRDTINSKMQGILDEATDKWGIKVGRVELKNIIPPRDIQEAMEKQMRAEREKRQTLLEAEAHKQSAVLRAEGDKQALILRAEAERDAAIARAKGEAESIRMVYEAEAQGLERLASAQVTENVLSLKKLDALKALGDGRATKLVVPTELASSASVLSYIGDTLNVGKTVDHSPKPVKQEDKPDDCCEDGERSSVTRALASDRALAGAQDDEDEERTEHGEGFPSFQGPQQTRGRDFTPGVRPTQRRQRSQQDM